MMETIHPEARILIRPGPDFLRCVLRSAATGLISEQDFYTVTVPAVEDLLARLARQGTAPWALEAFQAGHAAGALPDGFWSEVARSLGNTPRPKSTWPVARRFFANDDLLGRLTNTSRRSLSRYARRERETPADVGVRLHLVMMLAADLRCMVNPLGARRWWTRTRPSLRGAAPADLLTGSWTGGSRGYCRVRALADRDAGLHSLEGLSSVLDS